MRPAIAASFTTGKRTETTMATARARPERLLEVSIDAPLELPPLMALSFAH